MLDNFFQRISANLTQLTQFPSNNEYNNLILPHGNIFYPNDLKEIYKFVLHRRKAIESHYASLLAGEKYDPHLPVNLRFQQSRYKKLPLSISFSYDSNAKFMLIVETKSKFIDDEYDRVSGLYPLGVGVNKVVKRSYRVDTPAPQELATAVIPIDVDINIYTVRNEIKISQVDPSNDNLVYYYPGSSYIRSKDGVKVFTMHSEQGLTTLGHYLQSPEYYQAFTVLDIHRSLLGAFKGVKALHDKKIAHQDLKPTNILVQKNNKNKRHIELKVFDYGLARRHADPNTYSEGTLSYESPEVQMTHAAYHSPKNSEFFAYYQDPKYYSLARELIKQHLPYMSPESFTPHTANDIWSLGLTGYYYLYRRPITGVEDLQACKKEFQILNASLQVERSQRVDIDRLIAITEQEIIRFSADLHPYYSPRTTFPSETDPGSVEKIDILLEHSIHDWQKYDIFHKYGEKTIRQVLAQLTHVLIHIDNRYLDQFSGIADICDFITFLNEELAVNTFKLQTAFNYLFKPATEYTNKFGKVPSAAELQALHTWARELIAGSMRILHNQLSNFPTYYKQLRLLPNGKQEAASLMKCLMIVLGICEQRLSDKPELRAPELPNRDTSIICLENWERRLNENIFAKKPRIEPQQLLRHSKRQNCLLAS